MLVERFLGGLLTIFETVIQAVLPEGDAPWIAEMGSGILPMYTWLNSFMPVAEFFEICVYVVGTILIIAGFKKLMWLLQKFHILGS